MLYKLYIYLGKKLHCVLLPFFRFNKKKRVRIVVLSDDQHILLVRNWFGYQNWSLPGGGVKKDEVSESAIVRELYEETGLSVELSRVSYLKSYTCRESSVPFEADVYYTNIKKQPSLLERKSFEIIEREWHPIGMLPRELAMPVREMLKKIKNEH